MKRIVHALVVLTGLVCLLSPSSSFAVSFGSAVVDGNYQEWNLQTDFYSHMHRAGNPSKVIESDLFLRYDCGTQTLYALVLTVQGVPGLSLQQDAWIKLGNVNGNVVDGNSPSFAWIGLNGTTVQGWEASFSLAPGTYTLAAHIQVYDDGASQTSATTSGASNDRFIPLVVDCGGFQPYEPPTPPQPPVVPQYQVSGAVAVDLNNDGIVDSGDAPFGGVSVSLLDAQGNVITTAVTDANGLYSFTGLYAGVYSVSVSSFLTSGGQDYQLVSLGLIGLNVNSNITNVNFAYIPVYDISGVAFVDDNQSGALDANEIGLIGVNVSLVNAAGVTIQSVTTDANGAYAFENLPGGVYQVVVSPTFEDSVYEYTITTPATVNVNLEDNTNIDFGYIPVFDLGGVVFIDTDRDAALDSDEPALQGYFIGLYNNSGALVATQPVNADGSYLFTDLPRGTYTVQVVLVPAALNGFFVNTTVTSYTVSLQTEDSLSNHFGYAPDTTVILSDIGKTDTDGDGLVLSGTGKTIGFWKHQLTVAITKKGKAQVPAADLQVFVDGVEALLAAQPFQFVDTNEFGDALKVLESTSSNPVDLLKKQLLGTEFNQVSGRGLAAPYQSLQYVLIAWGESLAGGASTDAATLLTAKDIFDAINNTGE